MKGIVMVGGITLGAGVASADPPAHPLRLEEAIQLALTRNERSAIADLDVTIAEAGISKARVAFLPVLNLNGNDTYRPRDKPIDTANASLTLSQPLLVPSAFPLLAQAKHTLEGQRAQSADDKRQLEFDAARAFFSVLLADEVAQAAQRKLDTAKADLADTDAQVKAQLVSTNDVTRAQIGLAGSVRELAADRGNLDSAYVQLAFVINTPVAPGLEPPTALLDAGQRALPPADTLVTQSLGRRPDLAARKDQALAAHDSAREPRMRFYPTLGLTAQATATSNAGRTAHAAQSVMGSSRAMTGLRVNEFTDQYNTPTEHRSNRRDIDRGITQ